MTLWASGYRNLLANRRRMMEAGMSSGGGYSDKVLGYGPIAYWALWEAAGPTAECLVNSPAQDGTYTGVTLGEPGIGDGNTCPFFDGTNDFVNIYSAALAAAFDGDELTISIWARVFNAAVWNDFTVRWPMAFNQAAFAQFVDLRKDAVANNFIFRRRGVAGGDKATTIVINPTAWFHLALTVSIIADEQIAYFNGIQQGATIGGLGAWTGPIAPGITNIGAQQIAGPIGVWHGSLAHGNVFSRALPPVEVLDLATV